MQLICHIHKRMTTSIPKIAAETLEHSLFQITGVAATIDTFKKRQKTQDRPSLPLGALLEVAYPLGDILSTVAS